MSPRTLALAGLVIASACDSTPDAVSYDDEEETAALEVFWTLDPACPVLGSTAVVLAGEPAPHDVQTWLNGDRYSCADGRGTIANLPLGHYSFAVAITDDSQTSLFALSDVVNGELARDGATLEIEFSIPMLEGTFEIQWDPSQCAALDGDKVIMEAVAVGGAAPVESAIDCQAGTGLLSGVPVGDVTLSISLRDAKDQTVGNSGSLQTTIAYGNQRLSIGYFTF